MVNQCSHIITDADMAETKTFASAITQAQAQISTANLRIGARIKIVAGEMAGLVGVMYSITEDTIAVCPTNPDHANRNIVHFPSTDVQPDFLAGDFVRVRSGVYAGQSGWISGFEGKAVSIAEKQSGPQSLPDQVSLMSSPA